MKKSPPTLILLYVLLAYVVLQFVWWAYLIYDLNVELIHANSNNAVLDLKSELNKKLFMILGEGTVFISLLLVGAFFIRRYALREQRIAHQERNFLLATTHEFNSPIAAAKLNLQTLSRMDLSKAQSERMIASGLENIQRLEKLVSNILAASRIDAGKFQLKKEQVVVSGLMMRVVEQMQPLIESSGVTVHVDVDDGLMAHADVTALEMVFENLIQNALKYAPQSELHISGSENAEVVMLTWSDSGPGLNEEHLRNVLKKFYRAENEETRAKKGTGLGLYLVSEIVKAHSGKIQLRSRVGHGFTIEITLPKEK